jgi:antitoxin HigA-1
VANAQLVWIKMQPDCSFFPQAKRMSPVYFQAAAILGVGRPALSAALNGRASLSPEMALRFEKAFCTSMELMLKIQLQHDIAKTRKLAKGIKVQRWKRAG